MKKYSVILYIFIIIMICSGCNSNTKPDGTTTFTDDLNRNVSINSLRKIGVASGSLVDCIFLSGLDIAGTTDDAFKDSRFSFSDNVVNLGSLKELSLEPIMALKPDLIILTPNIKSHLNLENNLEQAGIPCAYFDIENFSDYLRILNIFTDLSNRKDLYNKNGLEVEKKINNIVNSTEKYTDKSYLLLRAYSTNITVKNSDCVVGNILSDFGVANIADSNNSILEQLNIEAIYLAQPDYIFVNCMGSVESAKSQFDSLIDTNPLWKELNAIKNNNLYFLEKELFHYKPNARWGESYEIIKTILTNQN